MSEEVVFNNHTDKMETSQTAFLMKRLLCIIAYLVQDTTFTAPTGQHFLLLIDCLVYLRAFILVPQIYTLKRVGTDDVSTGFVGRAVLLQVSRHRGLPPLGPVHGRRQRQVFPLQSDVVKAACSRTEHEFNNRRRFTQPFSM